MAFQNKEEVYQEWEVNTSDLADAMIQAIMTSRRKKRANAQNVRKWRRRPLAKQLFAAGFSTHCSLRLCCVFVERCNYYPSLLRGKWNSEYGRKIMRKVYLKRLCPCPLAKIIWVKVMTICTVKLFFSTIGQTRKREIQPYAVYDVYVPQHCNWRKVSTMDIKNDQSIWSW